MVQPNQESEVCYAWQRNIHDFSIKASHVRLDEICNAETQMKEITLGEIDML